MTRVVRWLLPQRPRCGAAGCRGALCVPRARRETDRDEPTDGLIGLFSMAERVQNDFVAKDVVTQTVLSPADSPLPLAGL